MTVSKASDRARTRVSLSTRRDLWLASRPISLATAISKAGDPSNRHPQEHMLWPASVANPFWNPYPMRLVIALSALLISLFPGSPALHAATCTAKDFAAAVDQSVREPSCHDARGAAQAARTHAPLQGREKAWRRLRELGSRRVIQNPKLAAFDKKSSALLLTVDLLGRVPDGLNPTAPNSNS